MTPEALKTGLKVQAQALGFDTCQLVAPDAIPEAPAQLATWLAMGAHGDMDWMAQTQERRADPRVLWPQVRAVVMLGVNYGPDEDPRLTWGDPSRGVISVYARHRDYHDVIKGRLKQLAGWLVAQTDHAEVKVFVDTAPVMEKPLAQQAGLGWQGKHTNLVSRTFGSWLFLGSIFTTLDLPVDAPEVDHCGSCRACLDACPTAAFPQPYVLDARRCVSYLTIEHKGVVPRDMRPLIGNRIYGCDDCLSACPWNKYAKVASEIKLQARADLKSPALAELAMLDDAQFRALFSGSPIKRIGRDRFVRNVLLAMGNAKSVAFVPILEGLLQDVAPQVRGMAVWALHKTLSDFDFESLRTAHLSGETDESVRAEWLHPCEVETP